METGPSVWRIVREAVAAAPDRVRSSVFIGVPIWLAMMVLQAIDSAQRPGPGAVAEFLSALLGSAGGVLLGLTGVINAGAEQTTGPRSPEDADAFRRTLIALPAIGFASGSLLSAAVALMILRGVMGTPVPFVVILTTLFAAMLWLAMSTAMRGARTLYAHARAEALEASAARLAAGEARLAALHARMNPHFLFNALNTVAALVRTAPARAERVTENLSEVLRLTLAHSEERTTTVAREATYVRAWLAIEQERWGDRLRVRWVIDPEVEEALIPPLLVQPLVENSLAHGMGSRIDGITIAIGATRQGTHLVISVEDDGIGFPPSYKERTGIGNLRERLSALHGERASLDLGVPGPGAKVTVRLPLELADRESADR